MKQVYFIDLECTVNGGPNGDSPEAHWTNNKVLLCGYKRRGNDLAPWVDTHIATLCTTIQNCIDDGEEVTLVAHNAKFDLKYLMRDHPEVEWTKVHVWDTMTWDYLASGHTSKFTSLEQALAEYNIPFKKSLDLGALLKSGVKMEDIPRAQLESYLKDDVLYLEKLYLAQLSTGYEPFMDYLLPLCEMELNGLPIDSDKAATKAMALATDCDKYFHRMKEYIKDHCLWQDGTPIIDDDFTTLVGTKSKCIKPMSNRTLSFLLFGQPTEMKVTAKWHVVYKDKCVPIFTPAQAELVYGHTTSKTDQGFPMSEDDLNRVESILYPVVMIKNMLEYRTKNKLLGTYITPFLATSKVQGCIYPKLNTTVTNTGRLSSSNPNGQNCPPIARELVIPAYKDSKIVEVDFSQLEMVGAATLSGDQQMIDDIKGGMDLHYETGRSVMGWRSPDDMKKEDRKLVKNVNFGLLYGGKATGLSKQTGVDKELVQKLIDSFYNRYPRVAQWQKEIFKHVTDNMEAYDVKDGEQRYSALYQLPNSGRRFRFVEAKSPAWLRKRTGRGYSFSPQHTANYPIQGFAGGDIVMYSLYWLWVVMREYEYYKENVKFRMTVHDSIMLEMKDNVKIEAIVNQMCADTVAHFNLPVDLHVDVDTGDYWQ